MIGGALAAAAGLLVAALTGLNLYRCAFNGYSNAYGRSIYRETNPVSFWTSVLCSALGLVFGLSFAGLMIGGLLGFFVD